MSASWLLLLIIKRQDYFEAVLYVVPPHHTLCVYLLYLVGVSSSCQSVAIEEKIIDSWMLGSDASAKLINVSLILAALLYDGLMCVYLLSLWRPLFTYIHPNEHTWFPTASYFECSWWQSYMQHGAIHLVTTTLDVILLTVTFTSSLITVSQK